MAFSFYTKDPPHDDNTFKDLHFPLRGICTLDVLHHALIKREMIRSYRGEDTRRLAQGVRVSKFEAFRRQAEKRLRTLDAAANLMDLAQLRSNRLEALSGDRKGQFSIRINSQWRICFEWPSGEPGPVNVEIVDYH